MVDGEAEIQHEGEGAPADGGAQLGPRQVRRDELKLVVVTLQRQMEQSSRHAA